MTDKPSIFWLTLESTRYDRTSLSDYTGDTTPNIADIAAEPDAKSFSRCFSHGIWTRPSSASILTGTYPETHSVFESNNHFPDELPLVPELLSEVGYHTVGFCTNGQLDSLCEDTNAFDDYVPNPVRKNLHKVAGFTGLGKFLLNLRQHSAGYTTSIEHLNVGYLLNEGMKKRVTNGPEPMFLYAHYKDPHSPYIPPLPYLREYTADLDVSPSEAIEILLSINDNIYEHIADGCQFDDREIAVINALYDAALAYTDERIGELVSYIKSELDDVIIVITGDHGELLGENGMFGHRLLTHDAVCHVPLVVSGPTEIVDYEGHIQHIDIVRTLLAEVGAEAPTSGFDLRSEQREYSIVQHCEKRQNSQLEELNRTSPAFEFEREHEGILTSIRNDDYKYEQAPDAEWLFALPDESTDIEPDHPDIVDSFRDIYEEFSRNLSRYDSAERKISDARRQQLQNMGYLVE